MGLGHQGADADAHVGFFLHSATNFKHLFGEIGDGLDIGQGLGGVTDHKVHLDRGPAALVDFLCGLQQFGGGDRLVDHIAHAVGGSFGGEGKAGATPPLFEQIHQVNAKTFNAQTGQADAQLFGAMFFHGAAHQLFDMGIVAAAQAEKADLFKATIFDHFVNRGQHFVGRTLAHGAEDHARLAEATAARTTTHNLNRGAVVDHINVGYDKLRHRRWHHRDHPLKHFGRRMGMIRRNRRNRPISGVAHLIKGWDIDAGDLHQLFPQCKT